MYGKYLTLALLQRNWLSTDIELETPTLVNDGFSFYENQDFEAECDQNYEGDEIPYNDYGMINIIFVIYIMV